MVKDEYFVLSNGVKIPSIGFGTWQIQNGDEAYNSTLKSLKEGYRHIDTAYAYGNEESIGRAIKDSSLKREQIFITSKVPAEIKTYKETIEHFNASINALKVDYLDLYLIHAPWPWSDVGGDYEEGNVEVWKALIDLYNKGLVRAIGVSNFLVRHIKNIIEKTNFAPMVNQIRYFIGNTQDEIVNYCQSNNILIEAYSPLATGELVNHEKLKNLSIKYNKSIPQICIRYCLQNNTLPLPKSIKKEHIKSNIDIDFEIEKEDMNYLNSLNYICSTRKFRS